MQSSLASVGAGSSSFVCDALTMLLAPPGTRVLSTACVDACSSGSVQGIPFK